MATNEKIVISGASGQLGKLVLRELLAKGNTNLIAATRTPESLTEFAAQGVEVRKADFNAPETLREAFRGARRLLLISTTDVGQRAQQHGAAIEAAKAAGVEHIIYTSYPDPTHSVAAVSPDHAATEDLILKSGLKYTFLGNYLYSEVLMYSLPSATQSGTLYGSAGDGRAAYVTRQDCAYAAAGVLASAAEHEDKRYRISGPAAYTRAELTALVSEVTGKPVSYVDLPPDDFKQGLIQAGIPEAYTPMFVSFDLAIKAGELAKVTQDVKQLSGHEPQDLRSFLQSALR